MIYEFEAYQMKVEEHTFWVAKSKILKGCVGQGDTFSAAINELEMNEQEWLSTAKECGIQIPEIRIHADSEQSFSGKLSLRISPLQHKEAVFYSKKDRISLNQYFCDAIAYYNGINFAKDNTKIDSPDNTDNDNKTIVRFTTERAKRTSKYHYSVKLDETDIPEEM